MCKHIRNLQSVRKIWHARCIIRCVRRALGPAKNGGNKTMAKKALKKAKKLEATKPLTVTVHGGPAGGR
jgi:hypothetical protein